MRHRKLDFLCLILYQQADCSASSRKGKQMKITVIHGQGHKGITYHLTWALLEQIMNQGDELKEFFLPQDGPGFCIGCNSCFLRGEQDCPGAAKVQPIAAAMDWADVLIVGSPNYVMEMSGALKSLLDHLAYRWVTHRPSGAMYRKTAVTICSSAGAPAGHTVRAMAKQLRWMGVSAIYCFPFISNALTVSDLKPQKQAEITKKAGKIAGRVINHVRRPKTGLRARLFFYIFRKMQSAPGAAWNPTDRDWWKDQGWIGEVRPWQRT